MAVSTDSDIVPSIDSMDGYGIDSPLSLHKLSNHSSPSVRVTETDATASTDTRTVQHSTPRKYYQPTHNKNIDPEGYKIFSEHLSQGGGTGGSDDHEPSFSSPHDPYPVPITTITTNELLLNTSTHSSKNSVHSQDHPDPWITLSPTVYTTKISPPSIVPSSSSSLSSYTPLSSVVVANYHHTTKTNSKGTDPKGIVTTGSAEKNIYHSSSPTGPNATVNDYVPSPIPVFAMTKKLNEGTYPSETPVDDKLSNILLPSSSSPSEPTTFIDIIPRQGVRSGRSFSSSSSSSSSASTDLSAVPGNSSTVTALRMEIEALRLECEERAFSTLEMQRNHAKEMDHVRQLLNEKITENGNLRNQLSHTGNKAIAAILAQDESEKRSKEEISILTLRLNQAQEDRDSLLQSIQSGITTNATALTESQHQCQLLRDQMEQYRYEQQQTKETIKQLHKRNIDLQADNQMKETTIRTLQNQVSTFIQREGDDTSRAEIAEAEAARLQQELDKRLKQLNRLIEAMDRARTREATTAAAMEAQNASLLQLQTGLAAATAEADRWREAVDTLQARHDETVDEAERWREEVEKLREERDIEREAIENATKSSEAVKALSRALDLAKEENLSLTNQLTKISTETRKEINALTRKCEEQQVIITGLRSDLQANSKGGGTIVPMYTTPSSLMHASSSAPASSATSVIHGGTYPPLNDDIHPHDADDYTATENQNIIDPFFGPGAITGSVTSKSVPQRFTRLGNMVSTTTNTMNNHGTNEVVHSLRLQCESLSRKLQAKEDRLREMTNEQEALFDVNERLRCALEATQNSIVAEEKRSTTIPGLESALHHAQTIRDRYNRYVRAANVNVSNDIEANDIAMLMDKASNGSNHSSSFTSLPRLPSSVTDSVVPPSDNGMVLSKELLEYIQQVEDVFFTMGGMLRSTHGLLSLLRAQLDGDDGIMDEYYRNNSYGQKQYTSTSSSSSDMLVPLGGGDVIHHPNNDMLIPHSSETNALLRNGKEDRFPEEAILISRLARIRVPLQQHLLCNLGKQSTVQMSSTNNSLQLPLQLTNPVLLRTLITEAIQGLTDIRMDLQEKMAENMSNQCITQ